MKAAAAVAAAIVVLPAVAADAVATVVVVLPAAAVVAIAVVAVATIVVVVAIVGNRSSDFVESPPWRAFSFLAIEVGSGLTRVLLLRPGETPHTTSFLG